MFCLCFTLMNMLTYLLLSYLCPASEEFYGSDTSLCNHWPCALEPTHSFDTIHFYLLTGERSACFRSLKTALFSRGLSHLKRFCLVCTARSAIYKCIDTIQYNTLQYRFCGLSAMPSNDTNGPTVTYPH